MIKKAIILAAGKGMRTQVLTNGLSKEMLILNGQPLIYYSIMEALDVGCSEVGIIINETKKDLYNYLLEQKTLGLPIIIITKDSRGMIDSMGAASDFINGEPFCMLLPDMLYTGKPNALKQIIAAFDEFNSSVVGLFNDTPVVGKGWYAKLSNIKNNIFSVDSIESSGNVRFFGRYVFNKEIIFYLNQFSPEESEKRLLDLIILKHKLLGVFFEKDLFDTGTPEGYFHAQKLFNN